MIGFHVVFIFIVVLINSIDVYPL